MLKPNEIGYSGDFNKKRKILAVASVIVIVLAFSLMYGMGLYNAKTVNVLYIDVDIHTGNTVKVVQVQYNHDTLNGNEHITFNFVYHNTGTAVTVDRVQSATPGFTVTSSDLPINAGQGQTVTVPMNILTPDSNYAGNLLINLYTSP